MKHCPACNFSFPDFHRVCDFDGTELVPDEQLSSVNVHTHRSRLRRIFKYPKFLTTLALLGLFLISALVAYLASPTQSIPEVKTKPWTESIRMKPSETATSTRDTVDNSNSVATSNPGERARAWRSSARVNKRAPTANRSTAFQIAQRKDAKSTQNDKDPKLVAMLKTTWRVLKKPFRF